MKLRDIPGANLVTYILVRFVSAIAGWLPLTLKDTLCRLGGRIYYRLARKRRETALRNLGYAYGDSISMAEKERIAKASFESVACTLIEFLNTPEMLPRAKTQFEFEGTETLDKIFARGKGVVSFIAHLGSWEYLAFLPYLRGYPCSVIVRDIKNPYLDKWLNENRSKTKLNSINRANSIRKILTDLKNNHLVAILIDQWAGPEGLWMNFFNEPTSVTSIPARLAKKTGAGLHCMYCLRTGPGKYKIVILPETPLEEGPDWEEKTTEKLNRILEQEILKHPEQWSWGHRRWKEKSRYRAEQKSEV